MVGGRCKGWMLLWGWRQQRAMIRFMIQSFPLEINEKNTYFALPRFVRSASSLENQRNEFLAMNMPQYFGHDTGLNSEQE